MKVRNSPGKGVQVMVTKPAIGALSTMLWPLPSAALGKGWASPQVKRLMSSPKASVRAI